MSGMCFYPYRSIVKNIYFFSLNTPTVSPAALVNVIEDLNVRKIWKFTPENTKEKNREKSCIQ
jgi:hypothetical protein